MSERAVSGFQLTLKLPGKFARCANPHGYRYIDIERQGTGQRFLPRINRGTVDPRKDGIEGELPITVYADGLPGFLPFIRQVNIPFAQRGAPDIVKSRDLAVECS